MVDGDDETEEATLVLPGVSPSSFPRGSAITTTRRPTHGTVGRSLRAGVCAPTTAGCAINTILLRHLLIQRLTALAVKVALEISTAVSFGGQNYRVPVDLMAYESS